jgi:hypothetical protein
MKYELKGSIHDIYMSLVSLVAVILLIVVSFIFTPKSSDTDYAIVRYNNEIIKKMPLNIDDDFIMYKQDYPDLYGDELIVSVRNKKVSITKEDSPFHYCSYLGEISNRGSSLICVPNCVRVTIESVEGIEDTDNDVDLIPGA